MALCCNLSVKSFHAFMTSIVMSGIYPDIGTYSLSLCVCVCACMRMQLHMWTCIYIFLKKAVRECVRVYVYVCVYIKKKALNLKIGAYFLRLE